MTRRPPAPPILTQPAADIQLEVLSRGSFFTFCEKRFRDIGERTFGRRMRQLARLGRMCPLLRHRRRPFYSTVQIVSFHRGDTFPEERAIQFNRLVALMHELQNAYMPEVRSNGRIGLWVKSRDLLTVTHSYPVSAIRDWRRELISSGQLCPADVLAQHTLTADDLEWWRLEFAAKVHGLDPLDNWHELVEKIAYGERQKLRYEALLAQDYRDLGTFVVLLLRDVGVLKEHEELCDIFDGSPRDEDSGAPGWRLNQFGREHLNDHFYQLELIANKYDINPKPRAIVFSEGDEWKALQLLFRARGFDPNTLGIEFRSIHSIGNFSFHHWRAFLEYMHEKQVLIYFAVDSERKDLQKQIEKFTTTRRLTDVEGLSRVLPNRERICVWEQSFEESNFTDEEIATAFTALGKPVLPSEVASCRTDATRSKGLAKVLIDKYGPVSKPELDVALMTQLISSSERRTDLRPVESFVDKAGQLIALNHQPTHRESIARNRQSGYLG